jgi:hypothetical protein
MIFVTILLWPFDFLIKKIMSLTSYLWFRYWPSVFNYFTDITVYMTLISEIKFMDALASLFRVFYYIAATMEAIFGMIIKSIEFFKLVIWPFLSISFDFILLAATLLFRLIWKQMYLKKDKTTSESCMHHFRKKRVPHSFQSKKILEDWFNNNIQSPYPNDEIKQELVELTNLSITQINNWFMNRRRTNKKLKNQR